MSGLRRRLRALGSGCGLLVIGSGRLAVAQTPPTVPQAPEAEAPVQAAPATDPVEPTDTAAGVPAPNSTAPPPAGPSATPATALPPSAPPASSEPAAPPVAAPAASPPLPYGPYPYPPPAQPVPDNPSQLQDTGPALGVSQPEPWRAWLLIAPDLAWSISHQSRVNGELTPIDTPAHDVAFMPGFRARIDVPVVSRLSMAFTGGLNRMQTEWEQRLRMSPRTLLAAALAPTLRIPVHASGRRAGSLYLSVPLGLNWALTPDAPEFESAESEVDDGSGWFWGLSAGTLVPVGDYLCFGLLLGVTQHSLKQRFTTTSSDGTRRERDEVREKFSVAHVAFMAGGRL